MTTSTIFGTVLDPSGSSVTDATVALTSENTGTVKIGRTDDRGHSPSHSFPLERAVEAMELAHNISKGSIKVQIIDDWDLAS